MFKSRQKIENKNWEHQWFPKLREISFKAEMSALGRTDWLTDSQSSLSSFYNIDDCLKLWMLDLKNCWTLMFVMYNDVKIGQ